MCELVPQATLQYIYIFSRDVDSLPEAGVTVDERQLFRASIDQERCRCTVNGPPRKPMTLL
jgi:hypothetical protein